MVLARRPVLSPQGVLHLNRRELLFGEARHRYDTPERLMSVRSITRQCAGHVIGNIYFVGSTGLGIYLVSTPQGHILINAGLEA